MHINTALKGDEKGWFGRAPVYDRYVWFCVEGNDKKDNANGSEGFALYIYII